LDGKDLGSHFTPISKDLVLKNTGTLDMASTYLSLTADGCDGGKGAVLAQALHVSLTEVTSTEVTSRPYMTRLALPQRSASPAASEAKAPMALPTTEM